MWLTDFFKGLFNKLSKLFNLAKPFLKEVLSQTAQNIWVSSQSLFVEAVQYVSLQGLPNDEAKRKAFNEYMATRAKGQFELLKESEINLLREMALAIFKKSQE
jgi:hypothetical protein